MPAVISMPVQRLIPAFIIAAVGVMLACANWRDYRYGRAAYTASKPVGVLGAPTTSRADLAKRIEEMDARLRTHPDDIGAAVLLSDALLRQTRVTGDAALTGRAVQILEKFHREDPAHYDTTQTLAAVYLSQHRFGEALAAAEQASKARPYDPVNYGMIGDAHLEMGETEAAYAAFDRMMALRPSAASYARVSYAREKQGNLTGAIESMKLAVDATSPTDPEGIAWATSQLGELFLKAGRVEDAKAAFIAASHAFPGHPFAVAGYQRTLSGGSQ